jgi:hypothetical protein
MTKPNFGRRGRSPAKEKTLKNATVERGALAPGEFLAQLEGFQGTGLLELVGNKRYKQTIQLR